MPYFPTVGRAQLGYTLSSIHGEAEVGAVHIRIPEVADHNREAEEPGTLARLQVGRTLLFLWANHIDVDRRCLQPRRLLDSTRHSTDRPSTRSTRRRSRDHIRHRQVRTWSVFIFFWSLGPELGRSSGQLAPASVLLFDLLA